MSMLASRRKRRWVLWGAVAAASGYASYRLYTSETGKRKRQQLARLFGTLFLLGDAAQQSAESMALISADIKRFLLSDDDEVPRSLRQALKITHCPDFQHSCTLLSAALTRGLLRGFASPRPTPPPWPSPLADDPPCREIKEICLISPGPPKGRKQCDEKSERHSAGSKVSGMYFDKAREQSESKPSEELPERLLGKLFSEPGVNFASAVVGNAACNIVKAMFDGFENQSIAHINSDGDKRDVSSKLVNVLCTQQCKELINECIQAFVNTAVSVYIAKTRDVNFYDDMVAGITNPLHKDPMKELLTTVSNGAVETFVKSSHSVMFGKESGKPEPKVSQQGSRNYAIEELSDEVQIHSQMGSCAPSSSFLKVINDGNVHTSLGTIEDTLVLLGPHMEGITQESEMQIKARKPQQGASSIHNFIDGLSKTLAIPSNHRLVVDVAGTMTSEAVRSFVDVIISSISSNMHGKMQRGWQRVKDGTLEQVNAIQAKAMYKDAAVKALFLASICLAICLHMLTGIRIEKV
ncbi:hypothetical protein GOP47_0026839 [Adiantum capillus-veneris]|nr:hypothetical protein GOP47_0026839 [Adiantum capillus-veneris]